MATKSKRPDDMTISAKILARIAVDKTQEAVTRALLRQGIKFVAKSAKSALKGKGATDEPKPTAPGQPADQPSTSPEPTEPTRATATTDAAPAEPGSGTTPPPPAPPRQRPQQQQFEQQQNKRSVQGDPVVGDRSTQAREVEARGTEPAPAKPAAPRPEREGEPQPETGERAKRRRAEPPRLSEDESEEESKATDAKATESKAKGDDDSDAGSTRAKDTRARGTKPPARRRPKEPPLPPAKMPWRERWKFYYKHYANYPPDIQRMLDRIERRTKDQQPEVDAAIREHYARELGQHWGVPVKTVGRIPMKAPEKLPLPRKNASWQQRWKYYDRHRDDYPRHIQELIDNANNRTEGGLSRSRKRSKHTTRTSRRGTLLEGIGRRPTSPSAPASARTSSPLAP